MLSPEQLAAFDRDGYLLASGLIPTPVLTAAQAERDRLLAERKESFYSTDIFNACYTEMLCAAAETLGGERNGRPYFPVTGALVIISPPAEGAWSWPGPHIDHAIRTHNHRIFPQPYHLASLLYLNDVAPHAGGTVVWPGSHKTIEDFARREGYEWMADLNENLDKIDLGQPQEVLAKAGDILFYHYLLAHSGSKNVTGQPRFAMNHKW